MMASNDMTGSERFIGGFHLPGADGWPEYDSEFLGLVGFILPGGWRQAAGLTKDEEAERWSQWFSLRLNEVSVRYGERIGPHLWVYFGIPAKSAQAAEHYADTLGRRVRDILFAEFGDPFGDAPVMRHTDDFGYGAAVIAGTGDRPFTDLLYEGFLAAASRLQGWSMPQRDPVRGMEMERILREGDIRSVYQPLFHLRDGNIFGYEALTRCAPDSPFDGPLSLFRYAEEEGYAFSLDRLAREKAVLSSPLLGPRQKIFINVNLSIMKDPQFVSGQTRQWLAARGLHPGQVVFELTERSSIEDFDEAKKMLAHYRSQGYQIAIDDAGAGYSSLQAIVELKPDYIKLDKSLVQYADQDEMKKHMLRTFVRFAKRMKIRTVAEGIERPEEFQLVRSMGIDFGQGFLIGKPCENPADVYTLGLPTV
ncbi:EAL domain-containing protein [Cohnella pontilimi]|uniref:EAL domain-containing protein n=1 Tax=Cohnella pontilimi TaxID=2564100 RepID=A0A4U0F5K8_9BACL|nr:EAL domain-containing protein [Cohnella pontilimi]TJY39700.1 EAL domain-containing protein [Cohnella pontilimi]